MSDLAGWVDEWDLVLSNGNLAEQSRVVYLRGVRQFLAHLAADDPAVSTPAGITRRHVDSWLRAMTGTGRSENTRRIRLKSLRLWLDYVAGEPYSGLDSNPAADVPLPNEYIKPV